MTKILILGGDADANLGDAAILAAICRRFAELDPTVAITVVSRRRRTGELPGVVRTLAPGPAGLGVLLASAARQDRIVFGGGGLIQDDDSRAKVPYWAVRLAIFRRLQQEIIGLSLGAGPLTHPESRLFARIVCNSLQKVSVRDEYARRSLQACTDKPVTIVPDPAFMLAPASEQQAIEWIGALSLPPGRPLLGVVARGWFHRRGGFIPRKIRTRFGGAHSDGESEREALADTLSAELRRVARRMGAAILFMPSYPLAHEGDLQACRALAARMRDVPTATASIEDPALYKAVAGRLALMVSARMHPLILAAGMGVPGVGLAYNGKFEGLFQLLNLPGQLRWLDELPGAPEGWLDAPVQAALENCGDLRHRCASLATQVGDHMAHLLDA